MSNRSFGKSVSLSLLKSDICLLPSAPSCFPGKSSPTSLSMREKNHRQIWLNSCFFMGAAHCSRDLSLCCCSVPQAVCDLSYSSVLKTSLPVFSGVLKPTSFFTVPLKQFSVIFLLLSSLGIFHYREKLSQGLRPQDLGPPELWNNRIRV